MDNNFQELYSPLFNLKEHLMWELYPNRASSEKDPHRKSPRSFENYRHSNKDANNNFFFSETINTIVNWLFHNPQRLIKFSTTKSKENKKDSTKNTDFGFAEFQRGKSWFVPQAGTRAHLTERITICFLQLGNDNSACVLTAVLFLHHAPNKQWILTC